MERLLMDDLLKWKNRNRKKPLIIHGARQVGKTWLMKEFGKRYYKKTVYINFENNERMQMLFEGNLEPRRLIEALQIESGMQIDPENSLLIFDEIQEVPRALTSLKYFCEEAPGFSIVAAGSLLGMALHQGTSFPVGKVDFLNLYPLNFREFLAARGEQGLVDLLNSDDRQMQAVFHNKFTDYLRQYYFIGGMPEAVLTYVETHDYDEVRRIQKNLLTYYENDFSKHAPADQIPRIQMVWNSIPSQLAKENRKFIYGMVREGARAKDFELAIQWLSDYGLICRSTRITKPAIPLTAYMEMNAFKLFMLDIGLLTAKGEIGARTLLEGNRIFTEFKGALTEQFVAQELAASGIKLYYYSAANSRGEIDFVVQQEDRIYPVEVKAEENLKAKSLKAFCERYAPLHGIRTSMSNYREEAWMTNVPLYQIADFLKAGSHNQYA
ncbi:MAG: AAA family ATPase [Lachnospiraceae bacterium]|nr:AAA family ATPase [Lachnospiraceae bacterium]